VPPGYSRVTAVAQTMTGAAPSGTAHDPHASSWLPSRPSLRRHPASTPRFTAASRWSSTTWPSLSACANG